MQRQEPHNEGNNQIGPACGCVKNATGGKHNRDISNDIISGAKPDGSSLISKEQLKAEYFELIWNLQDIVGKP
jgi:hypothetical protein